MREFGDEPVCRGVAPGRGFHGPFRLRRATRSTPRRSPRPRSRPRWAESSRAADDAADAQLKSVTGQPQGQPHPTYFRPRRPRASTTLPRPSGDLSAVLATAVEQNARMYRGKVK